MRPGQLARHLAGLLLLVPLLAWAQGQAVVLPGAVGLTGRWFPVAGAQPRPAVLALHGCGGMLDRQGRLNELQQRYAADLNGAQMHVLALDSFTARGLRSICEFPASKRPVTLQDRRDDVAAALRWLAAQPGVDATRLVLLGWSNGAQTVLAALDASDPAVQARGVHPRAAVAHYPGCSAPLKNRHYRLQAPLLMQLGERDDWTAPGPCVALHKRLGKQAPRFELEVYPGSYHAFDSMNPVRVRGHVGSTRSGTATVGGNPAARAAARERMRQFLEEQLR